MEYDLIYPECEREMLDASCIVAAVYFNKGELIDIGLDSDAVELDDAFIDENEFVKAFKLWKSPLYLSDFYDKYQSFLEEEYWHNITEEDFFRDVGRSVSRNMDELVEKMENNEFSSLVEPLDVEDEDKRLYDSIRVKIKQGTIGGHYPFRFYAIEVEENKCYVITGATIKVHKDMGKAPNTKLELEKLRRVYDELAVHDVKTKDMFIDYLEETE
ncbi:MAG: hypothetical protein IKX20_08775 [Paludibacteraceae bacterium]|nr:hypothetical protein [Paludibacteraceae bacterium]